MVLLMMPESQEMCTFSKGTKDLETKASKIKRIPSFISKGQSKPKNNIENEEESREDEYSHTDRVNAIFFSMRIVLLILGRFPFLPSVSIRNGSTGTGRGKNYTTSLKSPFWIYFALTSIFVLIMLLLSTGGFLEVFLGWRFLTIGKWSAKQKSIFYDNLIPFVLVWSCLLHSSVGSISFLRNRRNVVKFLNYWNQAVDQMKIVLPRSLKKFLIMSNLWFLGFLIMTIVTYILKWMPISRCGSALIGILAFRKFYPEMDPTSDNFSPFREFGLYTILYAMYASRALLFVFVFKCKLLRHCFKEWNCRLNAELNKTKQYQAEDAIFEKARCHELFQSHVILLKLVKLTDKVFAAILLSYYGSQILNMCFELYYVALSGAMEREAIDTFIAVLLLVQNIYVFLSVSLHAAYVGEEANKGFDIVKSRGISVDDGPFIRTLINNLKFNFHSRIFLTGGHYFAIDKPFIVTVLGAVFTYFVIILQYLHKLSPVLSTNELHNASISGRKQMGNLTVGC